MSTRQQTQTEIRRIAVVNRGEAAVRFLRALHEYNLERGTSLEAVAFYTNPDAEAPFVRMAHDAVHLGPAMIPGADGALVSAYCHHDHVIEHLMRSRCDAVWPGWGFVSEDIAFVARLEEVGITFIGPSSRAMELLGDKIASKELAEQAGVPLAPWSLIEDSASEDDIRKAAERIGFPLMVKASAGGGGRGIRRVESADGLMVAISQARDEVRKVFGAGGLFMESCITGARHVEIQLIGSPQGATAVGVRDCSIQRRNQKIIEEAPSPVLPPEMAKILCDSSVRLAELAGYHGAGTAEFLYQPATGDASFLEVNSRLQVEHTITECLTGADLVHAQIDIARGQAWARPADQGRGYAIEVRLNAEDPEKGFLPAPGTVRVFRPPAGPGIRVDSGIAEGMTIAPEFDSMIAKVIAYAPTRKQAIARLRRALQELQVVVEDGATNKAFLLELLAHETYIDGSADTAWVDRAHAAGAFGTPAWGFEALLVAAIIEYRLQRHAQEQSFFAQAQNGIPQNLPQPEGAEIDLRLRGQRATVDVFDLGQDRYFAGPEGARQLITVEPTGAHSVSVEMNGKRHQVLYSYGRAGIIVEVDGVMHSIERTSGGTVRAHAPAMVVHVSVQEGDVIKPGDTLCVLEAMKMEMGVFAQEGGTVKTVLIQPNEQVVAGQPLVVLEPEANGEEAQEEAASWDVPTSQPRPLALLFDYQGNPTPEALDTMDASLASEVIGDLTGAIRSLLQGFDQPPQLVERLVKLLDGALINENTVHPERWAALADELGTFANGEALFDRRMLNSEVAEGGAAVTVDLAFYDFCRLHHEGEDGADVAMRPKLQDALTRYGVHSLEPSDDLRASLWRLAVAHVHSALPHRLCSQLLRAVMELHRAGVAFEQATLRPVLEQIVQVSLNKKYPFVADNARQAIYVLFDQSRYVERRQVVEAMLSKLLGSLTGHAPDSPEARGWMDTLARSPHSLFPLLLHRADPAASETPFVAEAIIRRLYADHRVQTVETIQADQALVVTFDLTPRGDDAQRPAQKIVSVLGNAHYIGAAMDAAVAQMAEFKPDVVEISLQSGHTCPDLPKQLTEIITRLKLDNTTLDRMTINWCNGRDGLHHRTFRPSHGHLVEDADHRDVHPEAAHRLELWKLREFALERIDAPEQIHAFTGTARTNPRDERIFIYAEVHDINRPGDNEEEQEGLWAFEQVYFESMRVLREAQARRATRQRLHWNLLTIHIRPPIHLDPAALERLSTLLEPASRGLGLQAVVIHARLKDSKGNVSPSTCFEIRKRGTQRVEVGMRSTPTEPVRAMSDYEMRVVRTRRMNFFYPYEVARMLEGQLIDSANAGNHRLRGKFLEYDLDADGRLAPVDRPYGQNSCGVVVGVVTNYTPKFPEGMARVWIASDPTHAMCALAEPECRRILAAIDLAEARGLPVEWLPVSAGAKIAMDSGTENLDWTARVLRRIVEFSQLGGEINIIVAGVNVGAQSYWNAEATMLTHTRGILIMTPTGSMVLTGKKALEFSGGVAAEDERGIGGYERIMGPNGQGQYFAIHLSHAYQILFDHYELTYRAPGEDGPRLFATTDPVDRSVMGHPYKATSGEAFSTIGEIFDDRTNPERKKPFAIREVMGAVIDQDSGHLERFATLRDGETAVVWDAHIGGHPVCVLGIESRPLPRYGRIPMDGPDAWTGGTLFPQSSRKVARAINAASGNRPVVVLANLSGFDGSPESLRKRQLEYGAEIGRAVVNFQGPIIFVVISRYHGGAYVVFSKGLNPELRAIALEGTFASVIGGAPAAAVVFPREVRRRAEADPRMEAALKELDEAPSNQKPALRERLNALRTELRLEKRGEVAREFNAIHTVQRAVEVGSLDAVIAPAALRPTIITQITEGIERQRRGLAAAPPRATPLGKNA